MLFLLAAGDLDPCASNGDIQRRVSSASVLAAALAGLPASGRTPRVHVHVQWQLSGVLSERELLRVWDSLPASGCVLFASSVRNGLQPADLAAVFSEVCFLHFPECLRKSVFL